MSTEVPPSLPNAKPAWRTYLGAAAFLLPAINVWLFSTVFLFPRLETIWFKAGLTHSRAQWLLDTSRFLKDNGYVVLIVVIGLFALLEFRSKTWPRYRWRFVVALVFVLNAAVLVGLTLLCIAALLAVPVLVEH